MTVRHGPRARGPMTSMSTPLEGGHKGVGRSSTRTSTSAPGSAPNSKSASRTVASASSVWRASATVIARRPTPPARASAAATCRASRSSRVPAARSRSRAQRPRPSGPRGPRAQGLVAAPLAAQGHGDIDYIAIAPTCAAFAIETKTRTYHAAHPATVRPRLPAAAPPATLVPARRPPGAVRHPRPMARGGRGFGRSAACSTASLRAGATRGRARALPLRSRQRVHGRPGAARPRRQRLTVHPDRLRCLGGRWRRPAPPRGANAARAWRSCSAMRRGAVRVRPVLEAAPALQAPLVADGCEGTVAKRATARYRCGHRSNSSVNLKSPRRGTGAAPSPPPSRKDGQHRRVTNALVVGAVRVRLRDDAPAIWALLRTMGGARPSLMPYGVPASIGIGSTPPAPAAPTWAPAPGEATGPVEREAEASGRPARGQPGSLLLRCALAGRLRTNRSPSRAAQSTPTVRGPLPNGGYC